MNQAKLAPLVGIVGSVGVIVALAVPYLGPDAGAVGAYYGSGAVNPLVAGLLALVTIVVLAAGRQERSDPALAAGVALVFGVFILLVAVAWGTTVRVDVAAVPAIHRWATIALASLVPIGAAWFVRALGLV